MRASFRSVALVAVLAALVGGCAQARPSVAPVTFGPEVGPADFWVAPGSLPLDPAALSISGFIREQACASGTPPDGRIVGPTIEYGSAAVTVTFGVRKIAGGADCPSNPKYSITIFLAEALGSRQLLDGGTTPARDATVEPSPGG